MLQRKSVAEMQAADSLKKLATDQFNSKEELNGYLLNCCIGKVHIPLD